MKNTNRQHFWCRSKYCEYINNSYGSNIIKESNGSFLKRCQLNDQDCKGAHNEQSIKLLPNLYKYNNIKKNTINWIELYLNIIECINRDKSKIINHIHKDKADQIDKYNFIELIQLWRKFACYYRKIAKSLPSKMETTESPQVKDGFQFNEDVPYFNLSDNLEDIAWAFERLTLMCPVQQKFNDALKNKDNITIWSVCLATGINCKEGIHKNSEMICTNDFLTGRCNCLSKDEIAKQILDLKKEIEKLNNLTIDLDTSWTVIKNKKKPVIDSKSLILSIEHKINELNNSRFIHYSEQNIISFNQQYNNYLLSEEKKIVENKLIEQKKLEELEFKIKPVIKLNKFSR